MSVLGEQLSILDAIDERGGFDDWEIFQQPASKTTAELARSARCSTQTMNRVLADEERRGNVARVGEDEWRVTLPFRRKYGAGFRDLALGSGVDEAAA